jgi:ATP-dependent RNA helicase DDX24/MAK5
LAFGLPILQQILEFKEKQSTISENNGDQNTQNSRHLMALILSPTRELAKQIVEHLTAVAKYTDIKVEIAIHFHSQAFVFHKII